MNLTTRLTVYTPAAMVKSLSELLMNSGMVGGLTLKPGNAGLWVDGNGNIVEDNITLVEAYVGTRKVAASVASAAETHLKELSEQAVLTVIEDTTASIR